MSARYHAKLVVRFVFVCAAALAFGCEKKASTIAVHGRASYKGEKITTGGINFFRTAGAPEVAAIKEGEYTAELAPGDYTVAITVASDLPHGFKEGDPPPPPPKIVLPPQYSSRAQSALKATVKAGQTEPIDFDLK